MIMKYSRIAPAYYYQVICVAVQSVCIFLEGIYLYVHGDANAFVLRKINSILMRKLTSQKKFKLFFSHWLRTTWIRNWTLWAPWNWHCGALLSSRWALTSLLSGKRKKTWRKLFSSWPLAKPSRYRIVQHVLGSTITMVSAHRRISLEYFLK